MADEEKETKKSSPIKTIVIGLVIGLLVGGGAIFFVKGGNSEKQKSDGPAEAEAKAELPPPTESVEAVIYDLDPFIVNLADTPDPRYLKVTIKLDLLSPDYVDLVSKRVPQIRDTLLILLSSKDSGSIRTIEGKMELRDEILQRINGVFEQSMVKTAYFTDFVTQ